MRWTQRRQRFRTLLEGDRCIHPGSVFDPISARIAEDLGYEAGMFAGSVASMTVLGAPDLIVLTLSELATQAHRICRAGTLPLLVDADHGYGNALNVERTVEELEFAGVAALSIEDTLLPPGFGAEKAQLIALEEGVGKMNAALGKRHDPNLVIAGRTSAAAITDVGDAVKRIRAYEQAGVDAIFLVGVKTRPDLEELCGSIAVPVILGGVPSDLMDLDYLSGLGVRVCLQGHQPFSAAVKAVYETLRRLREGHPPSGLDGLAGDDLMKQVTRHRDYSYSLEEFLGKG